MNSQQIAALARGFAPVVHEYVDERLTLMVMPLIKRIAELEARLPQQAEKGDPGEVGPIGPEGQKGDPGEAGPVGPVGPIGPAGADGAPGEKGEKGDPGEPGPPGEKSVERERVIELHKTGEPGPPGDVGPMGPAGPAGPSGERGEPGEVGPVGPLGPAGLDGAPGEHGQRGEKGDPGEIGQKGDPGEVGPAGIAGIDGAPGERGEKGMDGLPGAPGDPGARGPQGPAGPPLRLLTGDGPPRTIAAAGTVYIDRETGDLYQSRPFSPDELREFCQDPDTGLLCGSEPSGGGDGEGGAGRGGSGGGSRPATGTESASHLYSAPTKTAQDIINATPNADKHVADARANLKDPKLGIPTDSPVEKGGFKQANGKWTPERVAVHQKIMAQLLPAAKLAAATPKEGEKPQLYILGGRGGSGKSFFTSGKPGTIDPSKFVVLNNDDVKEKLPEWKGWNAAHLHEESSEIGQAAERIAFGQKVNIVIDGTMKSSGSLEQRIKDAKAAGYEVHGKYMYTSPEKSAERALNRFVRGNEKNGEGRYVPPEYSLGSTTNEASFDKVSSQFKTWEVWDNNVDGREPKFHSSSKGK